MLKFGHFEMMRNGINRKLIEKRMFAIWRVEAPWKSATKKGVGHRMGSGKVGLFNHCLTTIYPPTP